MNTIILANLMAASFAWGAGDAITALKTSNATVEFSVGKHGAHLARWETTSVDASTLLACGSAGVPLWSVTLQQEGGARAMVTSLDGPAIAREASPQRLVIAWNEVAQQKLTAIVTITVHDSDLVWALDVAVKENAWTLWDLTFPEIGPIARPETVHSITTGGWGLVHEGLSQRPLIEGKYPSAECAMPFAAISNGSAGLYVGAEDSAGYPLRLFAGQAKGRSVISLGMRHEIPDMGKVSAYTVPTPVTTTAFAGDWYEAAQLYRSAAQKTDWGKIPALDQRKDVAKWLTDTDLWYIGPCDDEKTAAGVLDFAAYFKVPVSAHVYTWHQIPFDDHYPEYFPAKPGFKDAVTKVQTAGVPVMPYINGRLWDAATKSWAEKGAKDAATIREDGKPYTEVYDSKVPLTPMCPATRLWQDTVTQLVDKLVNDVGVRGVYIDQISAASYQRCFADNHGHPRGGGNSWIQGYRELTLRCRAVLPEGAALTTEENADPWNDLLHGFLMVNTHERGGTIVPLYPAVYGGRVVYFGFQYFSGADYSERYPLRLKLARELTFGSQLGWIGVGILDKKNAAEAEFLANLCQTRHRMRQALQFGHLLPPVKLDCKGTVSWTEEEKSVKASRTSPAVVAAVWQAPDGRRVLVTANVSDEEQKVGLSLDTRHTGSSSAPRGFLKNGDSVVETLRGDGTSLLGALTIPARTSLGLEIALTNAAE